MPGRLTPADVALTEAYPDVPIVDTSTRRLWHRCPRKASWLAPEPWGMGLQSERGAPALTFGTLIHSALDWIYAHKIGGRYVYNEGAAVFASYADTQFDALQKSGRLYEEQVEALVEMRDLGIAMLREYGDYAEVNDDFEVVATERGALVPVIYGTGPIALYYVRFDGLVRDDRGRLWVMEHKTCKRWWNDTQLALDEQFSAYTWAAEKITGERVAGVLVNFLLKQEVKDPPILKNGHPTTDWRKLTYTTASRYLRASDPGPVRTDSPEFQTYERLKGREDEAGHPTIRRVLVNRNRYQIRQTEEDIVRDVLAMRGARHDEVPALAYPGWDCDGCPVKDPCLLANHGADAGYTLRVNYTKRTPLWLEDDEDE